jgi:hypothetical protein
MPASARDGGVVSEFRWPESTAASGITVAIDEAIPTRTVKDAAMRRWITVAWVTFAAVVAFGGLVVPAQAGSISGTFDGVATLTPTGTPGVFTNNFSGDGEDNTFGPFTPTSQSTVDFSNPPKFVITNGMFTNAFPFGNLFGDSSGSGTGNGKGSATFTAHFVFTGGTGIFSGATGDAFVTGTITQTSPTTEAISATYSGVLHTVPEPGSLALFVPAAALGAVMLVRQRRRKALVR